MFIHTLRSKILPISFPPISGLRETSEFRSFSILSSLLNHCDRPHLLKQVHARFFLHGYHQNQTLSSKLIECYASLGLPNVSIQVFNSIIERDSNLYNAILHSLADIDDFNRTISIYEEMILNSMHPDESAYPPILRSCGQVLDVRYGRKIHAHLVKLGFESSETAVALGQMYKDLGELENAQEVSEKMPGNSLTDWNLRASECLSKGKPCQSFWLFDGMVRDGIPPDSVYLINLLKASAELHSLKAGKVVHALAVVNDFSDDLSVNTALMSMYSKLGSLQNARLIFDKMPGKDCFVWNLMLSAYLRAGYPKKSLELLMLMPKVGIKPDLYTVIAAISSAGEVKSLKCGKQIHGHIIRNGLNYQSSVHNCLIDMYCCCGSIEDASKVFDLVTDKTVVSWSSMIKGYGSQGQCSKALYLFTKMKSNGFYVDSATVMNILPACVNAGALELIKYIHGCAIKAGISSTPSVHTGLLVSYAKCGCLNIAEELFDEDVDTSDLITWNSMLSAYSKHGEWPKCFDIYKQMKQSNIRPDRMTFLGLLTACVNTGQIKEGRKYFEEMTAHFCQPTQEHYACMVDLLGRAGLIDEAYEIINSMPFQPDSRVWGPLLSACRMHCQPELAEFAAEKLINLEPRNAANYILLSNIYAAAGKWDGVAKMRSSLRDRGLKKTPGCSWLEVNGLMHEFRVADRSHPRSDEMYAILQSIELEVKDVIKRIVWTGFECWSVMDRQVT